MEYLFNQEVDEFFIMLANLNSNEEVVMKDFTDAFEKERALDIECLGFLDVVGFDFYYLYDDVPIRVIPCEPKTMVEILNNATRAIDDMLYGERDFCDLLIMVEKRYYLHLFNDMYWRTDNPTKRQAFKEAYTSIENAFGRISPKIIEDVFLYPTEEEKEELNTMLDKLKLDDVVTIYRGQNEESTELNKALSWTLDKKVAEFFANRFDLEGDIYRATVKKENIRWYFNNRKEEEVIVFYKDLENIEII